MKHVLSVLVENRPGVLSRVTGLISRRGFNIESLSVGPTEDPTLSRVTAIVLADEPTGALDSRATDELLRLFEDVNRGGQTILMVTHSVKAASHASRVLFIKDGEVFHEIYRGESSDEQLYQKISDTLTMLATGGEHHA